MPLAVFPRATSFFSPRISLELGVFTFQIEPNHLPELYPCILYLRLARILLIGRKALNEVCVRREPFNLEQIAECYV